MGQIGSDGIHRLPNVMTGQQQDEHVHSASIMEQQQQPHPQAASVQHAPEQPGAQQPPVQIEPGQHAFDQQGVQQQDAGQLPEQAQQQTPAWQSYSSVFTNAKAGMGAVDQAKVKQVVYEMSKNSAHFANEQRKQAQTDAHIARLKAQAALLTPAQLAAYQKSCDARITLLEAGRELDKVWLHVDMDAFYASVEELDQPALKDKPMAVGGMGMICTANYLARTFGVRSAMPGFIARKLCPQLVFVKPDFKKYTAASAQAFAVFRSYDERVQGASLDEAYLDVTQYCATHGVTGEQVAAELRAKVVEATQGLTCSVGVAPNMMLAKIASDKNKPNGQCMVGATRDQVLAFIADLPVRKIPGIGKVTEQTLQALGVSTCSDLISHAALLTALLSDISSSSLIEAGLGLGATEHSSRGGGPGSSEPGRKGISCERTFGAMSSTSDMEQMAESLVQHLASDMASEGIEAKTLTLKLKTTAFEVRTRAVTVPSFVSSAAAMLPPILKLLRAELPVEVRLMGVRGSNLRKAPLTLHQLAAEGKKLNALERLVLQARQDQQQQDQHRAGQGQQQHEVAGCVVQEDMQQDEGALEWVQDVEGRERQQVGEGENGSEGEGVTGEEQLLLQPSWQLPTQEELEAGYEQQCRQQQQGEDADADMVDAAKGGTWGNGDQGAWDWVGGPQQLQPPEQQQWPLLPPLQQHQQQQHFQQQQAGWQDLPDGVQEQQGQQLDGCGQEEGGDGAGISVQPSKRQRRCFSPPLQGVQHALAAAVPVAPPPQHQQHQHHYQGCEYQLPSGEAQMSWLQREQLCATAADDAGQPGALLHQQQQPPGQLGVSGRPADQGSCWHKASALALQHDHPSQPWSNQQPAVQHHHQHHQYLEPHAAGEPAAAAATDGKHSVAAAAAEAGRQAPTEGRTEGGRGRRSCPGSGGSGVPAFWTCLACTYSSNKQIWLRCCVCETPKGDTQPPPALLPQSSSGCRGAAAGGGVVGGGRGRGAGPGGRGQTSSGSRQMTLEGVGLARKQPKGS